MFRRQSWLILAFMYLQCTCISRKVYTFILLIFLGFTVYIPCWPLLRRPLFRQEQIWTYRHLGPLLTPR